MFYKVEGSFPLEGRIRASGNKNAALPCLAACLLTKEPVTIGNVPDIGDVRVMLTILKDMGCFVEQLGPGRWVVQAKTIKKNSTISPSIAKKIRASILLAGPLLAREGSVRLPPPGGDVIGRRRLDTHFLALAALGARIEVDGVFSFSASSLRGSEIFLDETSVTATENALMAAVLAKGKTTIINAASEPHVQDLCHLLNRMGGKIRGVGSNILTIDGVSQLYGTEFDIGPDYMEIGSFIGLAAITRGDLWIENVDPTHLRMCQFVFGRLGIHWETEKSSIHIPSLQEMEVKRDVGGGGIPHISDAPWPGFPPDLTSIIVVVSTQVQGSILIHEKMFESRLFFVDKLQTMGASITLCDPHRVVVTGPAKLVGTSLSSPDVRAGMAMVLAAMCAHGESEIHNVNQIERGYENLVGRLSAVGAKISKEESASC